MKQRDEGSCLVQTKKILGKKILRGISKLQVIHRKIGNLTKMQYFKQSLNNNNICPYQN